MDKTIKRVLAFGVMFLMAMGFLMVPVAYAQEEVPVEDKTEEVLPPVATEEEDIIMDEVIKEKDELMLELNETLGVVFAWIGGFSGVSALLLFGLRFIKDLGTMKQIREAIGELKESDGKTQAELMKLSENSATSNQREDMVEKAFINMVNMSNMEPKVKKEIMAGLKDQSISAQRVIEDGLARASEEVNKAEMNVKAIKEEAETLLQRLAKGE